MFVSFSFSVLIICRNVAPLAVAVPLKTTPYVAKEKTKKAKEKEPERVPTGTDADTTHSAAPTTEDIDMSPADDRYRLVRFRDFLC